MCEWFRGNHSRKEYVATQFSRSYDLNRYNDDSEGHCDSG